MKLREKVLSNSRLIAASSMSVLAMVGAFSQAVNAQTTPAAPQPSSDKEPEQLERVIVTSNRRNEEQQKVSGVVQSVTGDQLRKDGITEFRNLQNVVVGSSIAIQEGNAEVYIRGVGSANNTELGDPAAASHFNGVYIPRPRGLGLMFYDLNRVEVNKGPQGTLYGRNAMAGTLNIIPASPKLGKFEGYAQGEVSNRKGSGAEAALNIPVSSTFALRLAGQYTKKNAGFVNANPDPVYGQVSPAGLEENYAGRISALWTPTDSLRISVVADAGKETGTGYPAANVFDALNGGERNVSDLDIRRVVYRGAPGEVNNKLSGVMGKVEYDIGPVTAELNLSKRKVDFYQRNSSTDSIDFSGRNYAGLVSDNYSTVFWQTISDSTVAELRLSSNNDNARLKWNAGVFGFEEDQQSAFFSMVDRGIFYSGTEFTMPIVNSKSKAIFADGTFSLTKSTRVLGGLRYTDESKYRFGIGGNWVLGLGADNFDCCFSTRLGTEGFVPALLNRTSFNVTGLTPEQTRQFLIDSIRTPGARDTLIQQARNECFARADIDGNGRLKCPPGGGFSFGDPVKGIPGQQEGRSSANYGDFRLGFEHDLSKDRMVYAKIATGHKSGGFNDSFGDAIPEVYKPERLIVYELGSRNAFGASGRRTIFNVTGFYYDYTDQVFQDLACVAPDQADPNRCSGFSLVNRNVGKSRVLGLEAELRTQLTSSMRLDLTAALLNTKIVSGVVADARSQSFADGNNGRTSLINLAGNKLPYVSPVNFSARFQHELALGRGKFDWQVLLNYRSAYFLTQYNEREVNFLNGTSRTAAEAGFPDRQKGFATVNVGAGYTWDKLRVEAYVNNLFDEQASTKALSSTGLNVRFLNDARNYGLRLRYSF
jgi:iron complex outermembrane recepter protein